MLIEVKVPQLSDSVSEATLLSWHKKEGEAVKRDENLVDIETDKVVLELPAPADGVLTRIMKADGSAVAAAEIIATLDTQAKPSVSTPAAEPERAVKPPAAAVEPTAAPARAVPPLRGVPILRNFSARPSDFRRSVGFAKRIARFRTLQSINSIMPNFLPFAF